MPVYRKKDILLVCLWAGITVSSAQGVQVHSHNDYLQQVPFWLAFSSGTQSVEVDIYLRNDTLYATHSLNEIRADRTLENLYLKPIQTAQTLGFGSGNQLQLLVDIKSETHSTLKKLISVMQPYEAHFVNGTVRVVLSGNRPDTDLYHEYPPYFSFDYQSLEPPKNASAWDKIALISLDFKKVSDWDGTRRLKPKEKAQIKTVIEKAHSYGKPFRFWGTPDSRDAWKLFAGLKVDYINTDLPAACASYFNAGR